MSAASFEFLHELNDFLPKTRKNQPYEHPFHWKASIKDMIESLGVPHAEVELLVVNGQSVDFTYIVQDGDQIQVYPRFEAVDLPHKIPLRPPFSTKPSFILDTHLGRSAAYLRMLGFDTLYRNDYDDPELALVSHQENRILLTRDLGLLKRSNVTYGYFVRSIDGKARIAEIMGRFNLWPFSEPFKHCMKCNGLLKIISKDAILERISETTARHYDEFHACTECNQIYWRGSHYLKMQDFIEEIRQRTTQSEGQNV